MEADGDESSGVDDGDVFVHDRKREGEVPTIWHLKMGFSPSVKSWYFAVTLTPSPKNKMKLKLTRLLQEKRGLNDRTEKLTLFQKNRKRPNR